MRLLYVLAATSLLVIALVSPANAAPVTLPAGTEITLHLVEPLSSSNATVGQRFPFQAAAPVVVANRVVIAKGADGLGKVVSVSKAQGKSAGKMTIEFTSIHAVDGKVIALSAFARRSHGNAEKGKASTATIAATLALGPIGLLAHNLVKGKDITINPSQTFPTWVKSNTSVNVH